jgi:aminomethyltransferase
MPSKDAAMTTPAPVALHKTPLHELHLRLGARMGPFAGYEMPVQYPTGVIAEHKACREGAALFDVSHMGQVKLVGADAAAALETLVPVDVVGLAPGRQRYAFFTNDSGGLLDDLMIFRPEAADPGFGDLLLIVNAACKDADTRHLVTHIGHRCTVVPMPERALLALQGPKAVAALSRLNPAVAGLTFMGGNVFMLGGSRCLVTRSGYTGEDGFEISVPADQAVALAEALLADPDVRPAGLGARATRRRQAQPSTREIAPSIRVAPASRVRSTPVPADRSREPAHAPRSQTASTLQSPREPYTTLTGAAPPQWAMAAVMPADCAPITAVPASSHRHAGPGISASDPRNRGT